MDTKVDAQSQDPDLRGLAEAKLAELSWAEPATAADVETSRLIHELRVHQIELEMQNEELGRSRDEVEEGLREYSHLYDAAPVGYVTLTRDGTVERANLTAAHLLAVERGRLKDKRLGAFVGAEERAAFNAFVERVLDTGMPDERDLVFPKADGSTRWIRLTMTPSDDGRTGLASMLDVTERVRARETLAREHTILKAAESAAHIGSWRLHLASGAVEWSEEMYRIFGLGPRGSDGHAFDITAFIHPDDRATFEDASAATLRDGLVRPMEYRVIRADGEMRWVSAGGVQETGEGGTVVALTGFVEDITERKRGQETLLAANEHLADVLKSITATMGKVVETRDPYTQGHQLGVAKLGRQICEEMGLPETEIGSIEMAALVHDIGKLSVPTEILTKPGTLSAVEFALIKEHSLTGYQILKDVDFGWPIADVILQHHERMDGTGYPNGLVGDEISQAARVIAVADVVEAMASYRPYRPALGIELAAAEIKGHPEKYDPQVAGAFLRLYEAGSIDL